MISIQYSIVESGKNAPSYRVEDDLNGEKTLAELIFFFRKSLVIIADTVLKEEQEKGFDMNPLIAVDGRVGKPINEVNPFGKIEITSRVEVETFIPEIYAAIESRSPVDSGLYKESNFVFLNGKLIATNATELNSWTARKEQLKDGDTVRFMNVMPYSGKLERQGTTADRTQRRMLGAKDKRQRSGAMVRMPNGVYFLSSRAVQRKYRFNSSIKFEWINGASMDLSGVRNSTKAGKPLRRTFHPRSKRKGSYVYPSIVVRIKAGGVK